MKNEINNNVRNVGVELLRIVAMLMIVLLHLICHTFTDVGGGKTPTASIMAYHFLRAVTLVCVECYTMISGYVMVYSKPRYSRLLGVWIQILFYTVGICIAFTLLGLKVSKALWIQNLHPITGGCYWYMTAYFGMFPFLPFINPALKELPLKTLAVGGAMLFVFFSIIPLMNGNLFVIKNGYSTIWLLVCYVFGAVFRCASDEGKLSLPEWILPLLLVLIWMVLMGHAWLFAIHPNIFKSRIGSLLRKLPREYYSPLTVLYATVLLLLFSQMKIADSLKSIILFFSPLTLGVYLIHCHRFIWFHWIKLDEKISIADYSTFGFVTRLLEIGIGIYVVASLIDWLRCKIFEMLKIKKVSEIVCRRLDECM